MEYSKNIQVSSDFSKTDKTDIHRRKLEIASLNLDDYNSKLDGHTCKILYDVNTLEFNPLDKNDTHSVFITSWINYFTWWDMQPKDNKQHIVDDYIHLITNGHYEKTHHIISSNLAVDKCAKSNLNWFLKERNLFGLRFKDFHPIGFLPVEQEFKIKTEFNRLCQELDNLVKNPMQD